MERKRKRKRVRETDRKRKTHRGAEIERYKEKDTSARHIIIGL